MGLWSLMFCAVSSLDLDHEQPGVGTAFSLTSPEATYTMQHDGLSEEILRWVRWLDLGRIFSFLSLILGILINQHEFQVGFDYWYITVSELLYIFIYLLNHHPFLHPMGRNVRIWIKWKLKHNQKPKCHHKHQLQTKACNSLCHVSCDERNHK
jgi:hypothetical protein